MFCFQTWHGSNSIRTRTWRRRQWPICWRGIHSCRAPPRRWPVLGNRRRQVLANLKKTSPPSPNKYLITQRQFTRHGSLGIYHFLTRFPWNQELQSALFCLFQNNHNKSFIESNRSTSHISFLENDVFYRTMVFVFTLRTNRYDCVAAIKNTFF